MVGKVKLKVSPTLAKALKQDKVLGATFLFKRGEEGRLLLEYLPEFRSEK
jgi:hypothetical protein